MYKEIIISIIILIGIITLDQITQRYTKESMESFSEKLSIMQEDLKEEIEKEKEEKNLEEEVKKLEIDWEEIYGKLAYFIEHDELEKIETQLKELKGNVEVKQYAEALPGIEKCKFILEHIKQKDAIHIQNIF